MLRVFNIDPALHPQDVYLNNQVSATNIAYGNNNSYIAVQPGTYNLQFAQTGTTNLYGGYNIDFNTGKNYLMFLFNSNGSLQSEAFDASLLKLGLDTGEIRFFDFSPNAPVMDIGIKNTDTSKLDTTYTYYTRRYFNDIYSNPTLQKFIRLPSGTYYVKLRYYNTTTAFDSLLLRVGDRQSYTLLAHGYWDSSGVPPFVIDTLRH
ncbi:MAG TPA: DUF4397 domain-containing protein [Chitinophagaceae bacterium]|nr:DUF4397 domain-containing protein [Chitinophagaceae bacterium]